MALSRLTFHCQFRRFAQEVRRSSGQPFTSFHEGLPKKWEGYKEEVLRATSK